MKRFEVMVHPQGEPIVVNAAAMGLSGDNASVLVFFGEDDKLVASFNVWLAAICEDAKSLIVK